MTTSYFKVGRRSFFFFNGHDADSTKKAWDMAQAARHVSTVSVGLAPRVAVWERPYTPGPWSDEDEVPEIRSRDFAGGAT